eukprot:1513712-Prymnesium_polylepis.1
MCAELSELAGVYIAKGTTASGATFYEHVSAGSGRRLGHPTGGSIFLFYDPDCDGAQGSNP